MIAQLQMFGANIRLLIGLLLTAVIGLVAFILLWTGAKVLLFRLRQRQAERDDHRNHHDAAGRPRPPVSPGICHQCGRASSEVRNLPSGRRLCPDCDRAAEQKDS